MKNINVAVKGGGGSGITVELGQPSGKVSEIEEQIGNDGKGEDEKKRVL